ATWARSSPPAGVTTLDTVSCPSASVCYAAGGAGIMKSTNGGTSWSILDPSFSAESLSCFTIDECVGVGGTKVAKTTDGSTWTLQTPPTNTEELSAVSCPNAIFCVAIGTIDNTPSFAIQADG